MLKIFHPELGSIVEFVVFASNEIEKGSYVLDAGAGSQNYKIFFKNQRYESADFCEVSKHYYEKLDIICDIHKIPRKDNTYDAVLNFQVLEHVKDPQKVINEFYRVLKKGGKLFLTAPQGWGLHDEPHNYFNFARYGLEELFKKAGFKIKFIKERGGFFKYLTIRLQEIPIILIKNISHPVKFLFVVPLFIITAILFYIIFPPILNLCDYFFDKEKKYTLGYAAYCEK